MQNLQLQVSTLLDAYVSFLRYFEGAVLAVLPEREGGLLRNEFDRSDDDSESERPLVKIVTAHARAVRAHIIAVEDDAHGIVERAVELAAGEVVARAKQYGVVAQIAGGRAVLASVRDTSDC